MKLRVSDYVVFFKNNFLKKYNLEEYNKNTTDNNETVIMFGLYNSLDIEFYINYPGNLIVIWCGTDAKIADKNLVKKRKAKHIATSKFISKSLGDIEHQILPITPVVPILNPKPNIGNFIYHYGERSIYRPEWIPEIEKRTKLKVIHTKHDTYSKQELESIYEKCFIGLRLTDHDGISCTVLELGLMGRRSIFNGGYTTNIPWQSIDDVCESILKEYENRPNPDVVAKELYDYINLDNSWMNLNF